MTEQRFWRVADDAVLVEIRLTPKSSVDRIEGPEAGADGRWHLRARVRAVPEDGKANNALTAMLAKAMGVRNRPLRWSLVTHHARKRCGSRAIQRR